MRKFLPIGLVASLLLATGCTVGGVKQIPSQSPPSSPPAAVESAPAETMKEITLVDQDYSNPGVSGPEWLRAIGTVKVTGHAEHAKLRIKMSSAWSAVGMYVAPNKTFTNFESPDETVYGTHFHFIDATWVGNGNRNLGGSSNLGVHKEHATEVVYDLSNLPVTAGEPSDQSAAVMDILKHINAEGVYLGFAPSGYEGHLTITIEHDGDLEVSKF